VTTRVLLGTYGTRGDVEPVLALATAVAARGADVRVCVPPDEELEGLYARVDVPLVRFPVAYRTWEQGTVTAGERVLDPDAFVAGHIAATHDTLVAEAARCDVLLTTAMLHFVTGTVAEVAGVPHRFAVFAPVIDGPGRDAVVGRPIDVHRASLGLAPVADVRRYLFADRPWFAVDPVLWGTAPPAGGLDVTRTPAWFLPDDRPLAEELTAFLDAGPPPVYLGFGSMRVAPEEARAAVDALLAMGHRVLLARGWAGLDAVAHDDVLGVGEVNQQALFHRVAAVVHHGGAGTTATAARAGAPQVIVPQAADQSGWARRVAELGIGAAHDGPAPTAVSLAAALAVALDPATRTRAGALARSIRTDGAATAAGMLLDVADGGYARSSSSTR
jgi:vancomycin aglycone glucosyltransferase